MVTKVARVTKRDKPGDVYIGCREVHVRVNWWYRFRYILAGVLVLRTHGWPIRAAWRAMADDFDGDDSPERHEGYTPSESATESLSYWGP
jgi:hypothetical protein